jgi:mannosyltransferase OCH1-like enzyme
MPYSFSNEQMNGIVEDTYANIIKECENLKKKILIALMNKY